VAFGFAIGLDGLCRLHACLLCSSCYAARLQSGCFWVFSAAWVSLLALSWCFCCASLCFLLPCWKGLSPYLPCAVLGLSPLIACWNLGSGFQLSPLLVILFLLYWQSMVLGPTGF